MTEKEKMLSGKYYLGWDAELVPPSYEGRQRVLRLNPQSELLSEYLQFCKDEE